MRKMGRCIAAAFWLVLATSLSGCATHYLDRETKEIAASEFEKPVSAKPVQMVFEFQTNGAPNARATAHLKDQVTKQVSESGLFSEVSSTPTANAGLLTLTLNNMANMNEAQKKGFVTGLTFGAKGSVVTDGYLCTVKYLPPNASEAITKTAKHAIYTSIGANSGEEPGEKIENLEQGVRKMVRQIVSQVLNALSADPSFKN